MMRWLVLLKLVGNCLIKNHGQNTIWIYDEISMFHGIIVFLFPYEASYYHTPIAKFWFLSRNMNILVWFNKTICYHCNCLCNRFIVC